MGPLRAPESPQEVTRCRDGADSRRLAAVQTVSCSPERARRAQWATALDFLLLEEGELDPEVFAHLRATRRSFRNRFWSYISATDQVALEAQSLLQSPGD